MIKNQSTALIVSGAIALAVAVLAIFILGTELWLSIIIELIVTGVVFIITYNVLPYTSSELANADALIRRATFKRDCKVDLANIAKNREAYRKIDSVYKPVGSIIRTATLTLEDTTEPGQNSDSKLVMLHAYLNDFDIYFEYVHQIESGDLTIDNPEEEIAIFRNELPETVNNFSNLKTSVNAQKAAIGKAAGTALKMKMANSGMRRTTLKDIDKILKGDKDE